MFDDDEVSVFGPLAPAFEPLADVYTGGGTGSAGDDDPVVSQAEPLAHPGRESVYAASLGHLQQQPGTELAKAKGKERKFGNDEAFVLDPLAPVFEPLADVYTGGCHCFFWSERRRGRG